MKPKSIEDSHRLQRRSAARSVAVSWLLRLPAAVLLLILRLEPGVPDWIRTLFLILAVAALASCPLSLVVLKQRFQEIEGGELDEAGKY